MTTATRRTRSTFTDEPGKRLGGLARFLDTDVRWSTPVVLTVIALAGYGLLHLMGFGRDGTEALIMLIAVLGLYGYSGTTGIASFGHVGYMAVGGYVATLVSLPPYVKAYRLTGLPGWLSDMELDPYASLVVAFVAGSFAAALFGLLVWRLSGLAAGISTLAFLLVIYSVTSGWENVTGGRGAVPGVPAMDADTTAVLLAVAAIWGTVAFARSKAARLARAAREDEAAAHAMGARVYLGRWISMVYSGGLMAVAGALYVFFVGSISPDFFYISMMFTLLTFLVVGGMTRVTGDVVGTLLVQILRQVLEPLDSGFHVSGISFDGRPGLRFVVLGLLTLVVLTRRPGGVLNGMELRLPRRNRTRSEDEG
ncbi:MAG: leucine/isoleucine/valine transporter permease subunit [Nocardioides sp.]|nr:leucine/isoleucine/valine transporter permease subunit [Nocardioides sp.]